MSGHRDDGTSADNKAHHPSRKVSRENVKAYEQVGTYMGNVRGSHMFSAESTGGDSTDALTVQQEPSHATWGGVVGKQYKVYGNTTAYVAPHDGY
jgi:hypothetical protein